MNLNLPTPLQEFSPPVFARQGIRFFVKRDDLLHPDLSGNKWRKLKHNLLKARELGCGKLLTFGGAYSNHLAAVAAVGSEFGFSTMGVVRGERVLPLNPTLKFVGLCGMEVFYVDRANFRKKSNISMAAELGIDPTGVFVIPEGGSNKLALPGVAELVAELVGQLGGLPTYIATACGTGATLAGVASGLQGRAAALGIPVLKGGFMENEVVRFLQENGEAHLRNWQVLDGHHFGGYAKFTPGLIDFINRFKADFGVPLDPIYTGKLAFALFDLAEKGFFKNGETVVMLHTGGLQGVAGFNEQFGGILD